LIGCGDSTQTEAPAAPQTETQSAAETPVPAEEAANEQSAVQDEAVVAAAEATAAAKTAVTKTVAAEAKTVAAAEAVKTAAASVDGAAIFAQKCASCHGLKAEKAALGKSQVIAGWSSGQTKDALKGYQAGTYGKDMKALMQGQAKALNDAQIDAVAKHISGL
jgi:cytochrome c553